MKKKQIYILSSAVVMVLLLCLSGYTAWNEMDPVNTCAQCHEISPAHAGWQQSAHAHVRCIDCHGTAFSKGLHSLKEKSRMVYRHWTDNCFSADIHVTETQMLDIVDRCAECHQAEHAGWLASGHALTYREVFMDPEHNGKEKPYADCLRCHGMFYEGDIHSLLLLEGEVDRPAILCLSCHEIHTPNPVSVRKSPADTTSLSDKAPNTALYLRSQRMHLRSDFLTPVTMMQGDSVVAVATDPVSMLCRQCHAPNTSHQVGSSDDRTTLGIHAGKSCLDCHSAHSMRTPKMPRVHQK
ncbi:MAG: hypothetical protein LBB84_04130 [Tannerellaceae bacterium]|jgi:hypothetical protein|nr:hypothetical protein [Tannerellaceae bacterium]